MIDPRSINLSLLPSVPLARRKELPELPAIYFVMDSQGEVCYIGQAKNLRMRLSTHHRLHEFKKISNSKITYLLISNVNLLKKVELTLIEHFQPRLNGRRVSNSSGAGEISRIRHTYTIDERVLEVINQMAAKEGDSRNRFLEKHFAHLGVLGGYLPTGFKLLGETRGGDRKSQKAKEGDDD